VVDSQRLALNRITGAASDAVARTGFDSSAWFDRVPVIGETFGYAASALACDWYDAERDAAGVEGPFTAEPAALPDSARYRALVAWGMAEGVTNETQLSLIVGGMARVVANAHRDTVRLNAFADPACEGWSRFGEGECDFCRMLIGRGSVYSEAGAKFAAHDWCLCYAGPSFAESSQVGVYSPSKRRLSDASRRANNRRVREWIAANS
jgi:hypothetical protein